jgi:hypothetical protein
MKGIFVYPKSKMMLSSAISSVNTIRQFTGEKNLLLPLTLIFLCFEDAVTDPIAVGIAVGQIPES